MTAAAATRARTLLDSGDVEGALAVALEAWRRSRAPEAADALDRLDALAQVAYGTRAPKARTKDDFHAAWLATAASGSPLTAGWLAANLTRMLSVAADHFGILRPDYGREKHAALLARLAALEPLLPDPRVAGPIVDALVAAPFGAWSVVGGLAVYGPLLETLVRAGDSRATGTLEALVKTPRARTAMVRDFLARSLPEVVQRLRAIEVRSIDEDEQAAWRALAPADGILHGGGNAVDGESLLRHVRDDPDDEGARLVYADWLQERGDPLGELIVVQHRMASGQATPKDDRRARSLLRMHRDAWLGALASVLRGVVFERGFLAAAELAQNAAATEAAWAEAASDERLATLRELRQGRGNIDHYRSFVVSPAARALESIEVPLPSFLEPLLDGVPRPFARLCFRRTPRRKLLDRLARSQALPRLRAVHVRARQPELEVLFRDLAVSGVLARLGELSLFPYTFDQAPLDVLHAWPDMPPTLARLAVDGYGGGHAIERREGRVVVTLRGWAVNVAEPTIAALPKEVDEVRVVPGSAKLPPEVRARIEAAVAVRGGTLVVDG